MAYSSSVNNIEKYTPEDKKELFAKGAPVHIKGAILHNWIVDQDELNIPYIYSGERANILRVKETLPRANSIAFKERFPAEFEKYFEFDVYNILKTNFLNKCKPLFDAFGWEKDWETALKKLFKLDNDWIHNGMISKDLLIEQEELTVRQIKPREIGL